MNSLDQRWDRLAAAARMGAEDEVVAAPSASWVTRVGALGVAELRRSRVGAGWLEWAMPGFGVAMLVAILAVVASQSLLTPPEANADLVALADPLAGNALLP